MPDNLRPLLETIVSNVDEAITVLDPAGRFVFVNDSAARLLGYSNAAELLSTDPSAVRQAYEMVDESGAPVPRERLPAVRALSGETPPELLIGWRRRDMSEPRWSVTRAVPIKGADGRVELVLNFFKDVTEERRRKVDERFLATAAQILGESLDFELTLQKLAQTAVPVLADWATVEVLDDPRSAAPPRRVAIAHVDPQKAEWALEMARRWPSDWSPESMSPPAMVLRTGEPRMIPVISRESLVRAAKSPEHLAMYEVSAMRSLICVPLRAHGGTVIGIITLLTADSGRTYTQRDLEIAVEFGRRAGAAVENARLYAALRRANRQKDEFLSMLSHELRNPLAPITNALQLMQVPPGPPARAKLIIRRQLRQLTRLVDDLLDVSRIEHGKIELQREVLDLCAVMNEVGDDYLDGFLNAGLTLSLDCSGPVFVNGDRARLEQIAGNLLGNAVKFTPPGGKVRLSVKAVDGRAVLTVSDTGEGMDEATLKRLYEPFMQVNRGLDRKNGGLGLGLSVVRGLVALHDGEVTSSSPGLGQGSTFTVQLPLAPRESWRAAAPTPVPVPRPLRDLTVLVIDDNVDLAKTMRDLLAFEASDVQVEHSGLTAVDTIRRLKPDVVICDIGLPEKDGYAIAAEVRADPELAKVKLVALSGYGLDADKERAEKAGFNLHLTKPVPPDELLGLLDVGP